MLCSKQWAKCKQLYSICLDLILLVDIQIIEIMLEDHFAQLLHPNAY